MNKILALITFTIALVVSTYSYPNGATATLILIPLVTTIVFWIKKKDKNDDFLVKIFITALLVRIVIALFIYVFNLQTFFGEDSFAHEFHGFLLYESWFGQKTQPSYFSDWNRPWGLYYLIASTYTLVGRNSLAIQFLSCLCGALTAVIIFLVTRKIFRNNTTAKIAGLLTAFSPAVIIWSSQMLKDGFIVFFVVLTIYFLLKLQHNFSWFDVTFLLLSLLGILSIRFYIFYFAALACIGGFVFGSERILANNIRWLIIMTVLLIIISYAGVLSVGTEQLEIISDLERIQYSREVLSREATSGFGGNTDITTPLGALIALPIGFIYLMFAPFPWQFTSLRASLPLPEMLIWWSLIPFLFVGFKFTIKNRFRQSIPILLFAITLTIAYSLFQTNVGTAYRQRTQIQVFLFMFIAAGWTIWRERKENQQILRRLGNERDFRRLSQLKS